MADHYCVICGEDAYVGVGKEVQWLCFDHFSEHMKGFAEKVKKLKELPFQRTESELGPS